MKTFIILVSLYGLVAAGEKPCGLTIEAEEDYECSKFVQVANSEKYEIKGVTVDLLKELNPRLTCDKKIPRGAKLCVERSSKFNDKEIQGKTTLANFQQAMVKLQRRRSNKFSQELYDAITKVVKQQKRRKRNANAPLTKEEEDMIKKFADEKLIENIKAVIAADKNFKDLEDEFNKGRKAACAQLKEKEKDQTRKGQYRMCVCAKGGPQKYPNGPPSFIQCQAILMKEKMENQVNMEQNTNEALVFPTESPASFARASSSKKPNFQEFMTKIGCPTIECLTTLCFNLKESCGIIPEFPILSVCASAEGCFPNPGAVVKVDAFTNTKIAGKIGICVTGFNSVLSWIGLEACLAAIQLEYYFFKSQLDASIYAAYVVVRLTIGTKIQVAKSFSKGIGGIGWMIGREMVKDICTHDDHKCEAYCTLDPFKASAYVKVEYWWWGWKDAVNKEWKPKKPGCP